MHAVNIVGFLRDVYLIFNLDDILLNSVPYRHWIDVNIGDCQIRRENPLVFLDGGHLVLLLL